uniref:Putative hydantoin racemase n=1 Tax=uncultured bacterium 888 TaxID=548896 RepID=B8R8Q0_9BACT|nr:putative hydantoin racemase [uncultured bacterium 888]
MRIWWQSSSPIHRLHEYRNALSAHLDAVRRPETSIHISGVDEGSMDLHYNAVVAMNSFGPGGVLDKILQAAGQGYDAVAIGCFLDPAMQEAREIVPIPVFGMGETCMLMACMFGQRFSGVAFHAKQAQFYDRKAFEYGLAARHIPFGNLGIDFNEVQDGFARPQEMTAAFAREVRRLASQGAEVVLAACATVNAIIHREKMREIDGVLILDSNAMLLKITESMVDLASAIGLGASRRLLYRQPERTALAEWMRIYGMHAGQSQTDVARNPMTTLAAGSASVRASAATPR